MSRYLEEAAALLRKSAQSNEERYRREGRWLDEGRERIAREFATLAAIDKGLLPADMVQDVLRSIAERG
ncbi:hypothetical protein [Streptomyces benahoarensis]|uniref:Uncharacterized protein n=1 Tax=Streptomyces benahoarensis TaxID=2595054 RepID=A0A553ZN49_9ACTN|nr:hypothetical protein [Streptomyces benahoarensis]TSB26120.1 hypothetical protein FNJ62_11580 [Streptomyces benahoarensis]TSB42894.1 hypothetical protein FNZ23_07445 [Streptomyces benahoarensis]